MTPPTGRPWRARRWPRDERGGERTCRSNLPGGVRTTSVGESRQPSGPTKAKRARCLGSARAGFRLRPGVLDDLDGIPVGIPEAGEPGVAFDIALMVEVDAALAQHPHRPVEVVDCEHRGGASGLDRPALDRAMERE